MTNELENFYLEHKEPVRGTLLELRKIILRQDENITEAWKYRMPFFCYKKKMFCFLWRDKKTGEPYIGIVEGKRIDHPRLIKGNRARMKIMIFDPNKDIPVRTVTAILKQALDLYRNGIVKVR